ncbi:DOMON domain-containing protein [Strongyloides ratti]|uniref:DOMON domain-containing protein n=1 Tax=Strongyloides ratti TaxID=34506 RepID=A0A090LRU9_STRRB|nr:DOMON domain-containing protein [Strongyloides ratti]CEF70927.1 DOMON domain-containing protein [Strongyloides ratti]
MKQFYQKSLIFLLVTIIGLSKSDLAVKLTRDGCGETKACLFKPPGCDPSLDCTMGAMFTVVGPNQLKVQLVAQSLIPTPSLQYIAIGFSKDATMGDDYVNECVLNTAGNLGETLPEVFTSYNKGKSNDRTYLNETEHNTLFSDIKGEIINGRLACEFTQQIIPQISSKGNRILPLNEKYYILIATGSAQPDEVNVHDTSLSSHFFPIVSARPINPSLIGEATYDLPKPFVEETPSVETTTTSITSEENNTTIEKAPEQNAGTSNAYTSMIVTIVSIILFSFIKFTY